MRRAAALLLLLLASTACSGGGGDDVAGCGSAEGELPAGLVEIAWDNGDPVESVRTAGFGTITVGESGHSFRLDEERLWESVRFDLPRPARIHGMSVAFANFDEGGTFAPLELGLFPDFGHNGVDFWRESAYWVGDRCGRDASPLEPLDFVLEDPVEIAEPGLVFVGHLASDPLDPTLAFDEDAAGSGTCANWDECHSAVNMPDADANLFFQGVSLSFPYDFAVRLHVEWLDEVAPEARTFQPAGLPGPWRFSAWGDFDDDGWEDLLASDYSTEPQLFRNLGGGAFANVTTSAFAAITGDMFGAGGTWGDYDNDGCLDLYLFNAYLDRGNQLLHSECDGTFSDVTAFAGPLSSEVVPTSACSSVFPQSQAAAWLDIDGDSFLDLYVTNYNCGSVGSQAFEDDVYRNNGDGTFEEWSGTHGFISERRNGRGTEPIDYDQDGDVDLAVHNYALDRNFFFRNLGTGVVEEIGLENGLAGDATNFQGNTYYGHTLGVAWGDLDGDGDFDAVEANLAHPRFFHFSDRTRVLLQDSPTGYFFDIAGGNSVSPVNFVGLRYQEAHTVPVLGDFDRDGDLDLAISGRFEYTGRPTDFYWGNGDGTFELDSFHALETEDGWGLTAADYDHDGDLDLMTRQGLFRNDFATPGHWLSVRAIGNVRSNRAAIGATIRVYAGGRLIPGYVSGSSNQGCQDTQSVHFGLGDIDQVDGIEVLFPGGRHARYDGPFGVDQPLRLFEDGTALQGW